MVRFRQQLHAAGGDEFLEGFQHIGPELAELLDDRAGDGKCHAKPAVAFLDALAEHLVGGQVAFVSHAMEDLAVELLIEPVRLVHLEIKADVGHGEGGYPVEGSALRGAAGRP